MTNPEGEAATPATPGRGARRLESNPALAQSADDAAVGPAVESLRKAPLDKENPRLE